VRSAPRGESVPCHFQRVWKRLLWSTSASCHLTASSKVPHCLMDPLSRGLPGSAGLSSQSLTMKNRGGPSALKHIPLNKVTTIQSPTLSCLIRQRFWLRGFHSRNVCKEQSTGTFSSPSIAHITSSSVISRGIFHFLFTGCAFRKRARLSSSEAQSTRCATIR